ncbi:MAG: hypothetical protein ABDH49_06195 [Candidatus Hydrothermales bacterium]
MMERRSYIITGLLISIFLLATLLYFFVRWILSETNRWLIADAENFSNAIFTSLTESIKIPWETGDDISLNSIIYSIKKENREINEISIIDRDFTIIAHTNPENILNKFVLPEEAPFNLRSLGLTIKNDKVFIFKPSFSTLGDTLGYIYVTLSPRSLKEGRDSLRRILFLFVVALSALFLFFSAVFLFLSTPEQRKKLIFEPNYKDFLSSNIPESGGYRPENWLLYSFFEKGEIPNIFYRVFRVSPERWGILSFQVISGGYTWSLLFPFINSYLDKFLFTEEDPFVIIKGLHDEFSKIMLNDGIVEGSLLFFDERKKKISGASFGDHILFVKRNNQLLPVFEPAKFYDFSNKKSEVKYFETDFQDLFVLITGNFYRWQKYNELMSKMNEVKNEDDIKLMIENLRFLYSDSKIKEGILVLFLNKIKEEE